MAQNILFIILGYFFQHGSSVLLQKKSLSEDPLAVCNDGTPAAYYAQNLTQLTSEDVVIFLEGGGACFTVESCQQRCEVDSPHLCTEDPAEFKDFGNFMWSDDETENPAFHSFFKVYVPYCSSDIYSGTRNASSDTNNYFFHGKHIVRAVLEDIIRNILGMKEVRQLVFIGASAGAMGVEVNCDLMAEMFTQENPLTDIRCIADGGDFFPTWLNSGQCDHYQIANMANQFWHTEGDQSCYDSVEEGSLDCIAFSSLFPYISTKLMVVSNYVDINMELHPCTPPIDQDPEFWKTWKTEMRGLAYSFMEEKLENAIFLTNCPYHVSVTNIFGWNNISVPLVGEPGKEVYKNLIRNWLEDSGPYRAVDEAQIQNPDCPY